jgi:hypothetical protein
MQILDKSPRIVVPVNNPAQTPEDAAKGRDCVLLEFPCAIRLTIDANHQIHFPSGVHPVSRELADHWWLRAHKVKPYSAPVVPAYVPANQKKAAKANK